MADSLTGLFAFNPHDTCVLDHKKYPLTHDGLLSGLLYFSLSYEITNKQ